MTERALRFNALSYFLPSAHVLAGKPVTTFPGHALLLLTHLGFHHDLTEPLALAGNESHKLGDRPTGRFDAARRQLFRHLGGLQPCLQRLIHLVDDRLRRGARREQAGPMADLDRRITLLGRRRQRRISADAFRVGRGDRLQQTGLDLRQHDDARFRRRRCRARQDRVHAVIAAAERHDGHGDAGCCLHHLGDEMRRAAAAGGRPGHAPLALRLRPGDELLHVGGGHARIDDDGRRRHRDHADRHEVFVPVAQVLDQHAVGDDAGPADQERVTIGRSLCDRRRADHRAGARAVLNDDRLTEVLARRLGRDACDQIVGATRTERHDPADRPIRPLRACRRHRGDADKNGCSSKQSPAQHRVLPRTIFYGYLDCAA